MEDLFRDYWWLLFPIAGFAFGAWDRWLSYRRSREELELIKTFAAQGKDVPVELLRRIHEREEEEPADEWGGRRRRRHRHHRRDDMRTAIFTGAIACAFWVASELSVLPGTEGPFRLAALILTFIAGATLLSAVLASRFRDK